MKKKLIIFMISLVTVCLFGFIVWGLTPQKADPVALNALKNDGDVEVIQQNNLIVFKPLNVVSDTGLIFYPGGHVDPRSYAHLLRKIASNGYTVVLVRMPLNLAVLGSQKAMNIPDKFPQINTWVIAGHSVGGAMAAAYSAQHPDKVDGLILWGSYPPSSTDLSEVPLPTLSIYGSLDGLSSVEEIEETKTNLPNKTIFQEITGGNHSQFGSYGFQKGDLIAEISPEDQQALVVSDTVVFLSDLN